MKREEYIFLKFFEYVPKIITLFIFDAFKYYSPYMYIFFSLTECNVCPLCTQAAKNLGAALVLAHFIATQHCNL